MDLGEPRREIEITPRRDPVPRPQRHQPVPSPGPPPVKKPQPAEPVRT